MLLSDLQILERLVRDDPECIFVSPLIDPVLQLGPSSLDVRIGSEIKTPRVIGSTCIDLTASGEEIERQISQYFETRRVSPEEAFVLHPGEFALASTLEFIRLPRDIAARLEGRSSYGRLGIEVHSTAGFVDPGYDGNLTFELKNSGKLPVKLRPGLRVAQLCFFTVNDVQVPYNLRPQSKYGGLQGVGLSRIHLDMEVARARSVGQ
ncbi:MAG: dCTP deaminase [Planctomycetes bacterium]|nr:dCTP deaminase [Planctomycetota bacterium]